MKNQKKKNNNDSDDEDDDESLRVQEQQWHVPASIRANSCCWGDSDNILHDFWENSSEERKRVRWHFPSNLDPSNNTNANNANTQNNNIMDDGMMFMKRPHDFVARKLNGANNKFNLMNNNNNNNNNNGAAPAPWFQRTEHHLQIHRSEDQSDVRTHHPHNPTTSASRENNNNVMMMGGGNDSSSSLLMFNNNNKN